MQQLFDRATEVRHEVLAEQHASLVLPAGCGKTEILAAVVASAVGESSRVLVLTHTNAGVGAIRSRLQRYGVAWRHVRVATIDAFMQRVARSFPSLGPALELTEDEAGYWTSLRTTALAIQGRKAILDLMQASYDLLVVDEYQDCSVVQHEFVKALAARVRTLLLGDPLQAIFNIQGNVLVDWGVDVSNVFPELDAGYFGQAPWRWMGKNDALGEWLLSVLRPSLIAGSEVELDGIPGLTWRESNQQNLQGIHQPYVTGSASTVFILPQQYRVRPFAKMRGGRFPALEDKQMSAAMAEARRLDDVANSGPATAGCIVKIMDRCATRVAAVVSGGSKAQLVARLEAGTALPGGATGSRGEIRSALNGVMDAPTPVNVATALRACRGAPEIKVYARDCVLDLIAVVEARVHGDSSTYAEGVAKLRLSRRFSSQRVLQCSSHTLLVKGLEFERCIVVDAHQLASKENFYVALTRGSRELRVVSAAPSVQF